MRFKGESYTYLKAKKDAGFCEWISMTLQVILPSSPSYFDLLFMRVNTQDIQINCARCEAELSPRFQDSFAFMETGDQFSQQVCQPITDTFKIRQYLTGGIHKDATGADIEVRAIRIKDLIPLILSEFYDTAGGGPMLVTGSVFGSSWLQEVWTITFPDPADLEEYEVIITTEIGSVYTITVIASIGDDETDLSEKVANLIRAADYNDLDSSNIDKLIHRFSEVTPNSPAGTVVISADFPFSVSVNVDGIPAAIASQTTALQYGLADLCLTGPGLTGRICLSIQQVFDLINALYPFYINRATDNLIAIEPKANLLSTSIMVPSQEDIEGVETISQIEPDEIKGRALFGRIYNLSNYEDSETNWQRFGQRADIPNPLISSVPGIEGSFDFLGAFSLNNAGASQVDFKVEMLLDAVKIGESGVLSVAPSSQLEITVGSFGLLVVDTIGLYITPASTVEVQISYIVGSGLTLVGGSSTLYVESSNPAHGWKENEGLFTPDPYLPLIDFSDCKGVIERAPDSAFYTGLGYKFSQQLQGLNDYEDTHFMFFADPIIDESRQFRRELYFAPGTAPVGFDGEVVTFYMDNTPLSPPIQNWLHAKTLASDIGVRGYDFIISMNAGGAITYSDNERGGVIPKGHSYTEKKTFSKGVTLEQFYYQAISKILNLAECGSTKQCLIKSATYSFGAGSSEYEVISQ